MQQYYRGEKRVTLIVTGCVIGLLLIIFLSRAIKVVSPGFVGIRVLFGKVVEPTLKEGLHFVNPLASVIRVDTRTQAYTMSGMVREGRVRGDDAISALTKEGLRVKLDLTIWYRVDPEKAGEIYRTIGMGYEDKIVRPGVRTVIRDITSRFTTEDIYAEKRPQVTAAIQSVAKEMLEDRGMICEKVLVRNVALPEKVRDAIDLKLAAEQDALKMEFVLKKAEKQAEVKVVEAKGIAQAQRIINRTLTVKYLQHEAIEAYKALAGSPNTTFIIMPTSPEGAGIPLIIGK
ncbi:MAG: prohibitin family protein [candidate division WOR-3 bacterium]|nr:prohibitin family protein [candidate division WOR-3 bacterium]